MRSERKDRIMAITLDNLQRKHDPKPPRIIVHGPHGVGKTTLLTTLPNPVVVQTEDGLGLIDVPHFPLATCYQDVVDALNAVGDAGEFNSLVLDSLDHLDYLIHAEVCRKNGWSAITQPDYGKGYGEIVPLWREIMRLINSLRNDCGMVIGMTAHSLVRTFNDPEQAGYDRYEIKLTKTKSVDISGLVQESADMVLFANFDTATSELKSDNKRVIGKGAGTRSLYSEKRPAFDAKNRHKLPAKVVLSDPFDWEVYKPAFPNEFFG